MGVVKGVVYRRGRGWLLATSPRDKTASPTEQDNNPSMPKAAVSLQCQILAPHTILTEPTVASLHFRANFKRMAQLGDSHCSDSEATQPAAALYNVHRSTGRIIQNYPASVEEPASGSVLDYSEVASAVYTIRKGPQGVQKNTIGGS